MQGGVRSPQINRGRGKALVADRLMPDDTFSSTLYLLLLHRLQDTLRHAQNGSCNKALEGHEGHKGKVRPWKDCWKLYHSNTFGLPLYTTVVWHASIGITECTCQCPHAALSLFLEKLH